MPLRIYNSQSREKETFTPTVAGRVRMYVCGITAYDYAHLGHARCSVVFDVVFRYLRHLGLAVDYVRNFTDIDDKILKRAAEEGCDWKELAERYIATFAEDMRRLGNLPPSSEPRATDFIAEMQTLIQSLTEKKLAYPGGGDVFFAVRDFPSYGALSGRNLDELESGARVEVDEAKRDPLDFALWKSAKPGEPAWDSPWGPGRPGWHIECSAMSMKLLGTSLDIHGGGRDLTFPHHENERAQSEGASGTPFVKYWMHNGFVNLNADKMSKSTGNFLSIRDVLAQYPAEAVRYFLLSSHYRSPLDFNEQGMREAMVAVERLYGTLARLANYAAPGQESGEGLSVSEKMTALRDKFLSAMEDDFNTASALGVAFEAVRELNRFFDQAPGAKAATSVLAAWKEFLGLIQNCLGLLKERPEDFFLQVKRIALEKTAVSPEQVEAKLAARREARANKDYALSDRIRQELGDWGVLIKDNPDGTTTWSLKSST